MYKKLEQVVAVAAALSWTTSAIYLGADITNNSVAELLASTTVEADNKAGDPMSELNLSQVDAQPAITKIPNKEVLAYLEYLEQNRWSELARYGPIEMTQSNLDIFSSEPQNHGLENLIYDNENMAQFAPATPASGSDVFFAFKDGQSRRINGVAFTSSSTDPDHAPTEVTISWNVNTNPVQSVTFALDFEGELMRELYFDLPDRDIGDLKFHIKNPNGGAGYGNMQLGQIKLFGPSAADITTGENEIANGDYSTEDWYVYTASDAAGAGEECIKASRTTTTSGYYVDSSVMDVPKAECCAAGATLDQAQLKLACDASPPSPPSPPTPPQPLPLHYIYLDENNVTLTSNGIHYTNGAHNPYELLSNSSHEWIHDARESGHVGMTAAYVEYEFANQMTFNGVSFTSSPGAGVEGSWPNRVVISWYDNGYQQILQDLNFPGMGKETEIFDLPNLKTANLDSPKLNFYFYNDDYEQIWLGLINLYGQEGQ